MRRPWWLLMLTLVSSACFHPDPAAGAPCGPGDVCPTGLSCIDGRCTTGGGSGSSDECTAAADGTACGSSTTSECSAADTCVAELCVSNDLATGSSCYDCAAGAAACASCEQGTCRDSTCVPSGAPRPAVL